MKTVYLIHGIKTKDHERSSISFFKYIMPRFKVVPLSYGYWPALLALIMPLINRFVVKKLIKQIHPGQILMGHSNGCTVAYGISNQFYVKGLVLINPALDEGVVFDPFLEFVHIYWSHDDSIVKLSSFMPWSLWGLMGATGYKGNDPRVRQWEMPFRHTSIGDAEVAVRWGPIIVSNLEKEVLKNPG